ncbi:MAG TPA: hypothetical protein VGS96_01710 [Thermoanaerobaculia bacterium]|nr:hypothetical protein [Thermoanaerobaculia bacterium]
MISSEQRERWTVSERAIEGHGVLAACSAVAAADDVVGKIAGAVSIFIEGPVQEVAIIERKKSRTHDLVERRGNRRLAESIGASENPDQLTQHKIVYVQRCTGFDGLGDEGINATGLSGIILREIAHEDVGVDPNHRFLE